MHTYDLLEKMKIFRLKNQKLHFVVTNNVHNRTPETCSVFRNMFAFFQIKFLCPQMPVYSNTHLVSSSKFSGISNIALSIATSPKVFMVAIFVSLRMDDRGILITSSSTFAHRKNIRVDDFGILPSPNFPLKKAS